MARAQTARVRLNTITRDGPRRRIWFEWPEGRRGFATLLNPEVLQGRLPPGAEVVLELKESGAGWEATLQTLEDDQLPEALAKVIRELPELYAVPLGVTTLPDRDGGGTYLHLSEGRSESRVSLGRYELTGFTGQLLEPQATWTIRPRLLDRHLASYPCWSLRVDTWRAFDRKFVLTAYGAWAPTAGSDCTPELTAQDLVPARHAQLVDDQNHSFYWTRFDPALFRAFSRAGFIGITRNRGDRVFLLPELQGSYAALLPTDLRVDRGVRAILRSGRLVTDDVRLVFNADPRGVLDRLAVAWGEGTWLDEHYRDLILDLAARPTPEFAVWGVELRVGGEQELVAGELGYTIGGSYTSLSGFMDRTRPEWNNFGKLQLVMMIRELADRGYTLHNLGHPRMEYKTRLGAKILPRREFLSLWTQAVGTPPDRCLATEVGRPRPVSARSDAHSAQSALLVGGGVRRIPVALLLPLDGGGRARLTIHAVLDGLVSILETHTFEGAPAESCVLFDCIRELWDSHQPLALDHDRAMDVLRGSLLHRWIVVDAIRSAIGLPQSAAAVAAINAAQQWVLTPGKAAAAAAAAAAWATATYRSEVDAPAADADHAAHCAAYTAACGAPGKADSGYAAMVSPGCVFGAHSSAAAAAYEQARQAAQLRFRALALIAHLLPEPGWGG